MEPDDIEFPGEAVPPPAALLWEEDGGAAVGPVPAG